MSRGELAVIRQEETLAKLAQSSEAKMAPSTLGQSDWASISPLQSLTDMDYSGKSNVMTLQLRQMDPLTPMTTIS